METVFFKDIECHTYGTVPTAGQRAPEFELINKDLREIRLSDYDGRRVVLNIFPSLDTPVCANSVRRFNKDAADMPDTSVICVSMDLPFAQGRFCSANDINHVEVASAFRSPEFGQKYGVVLVDGPLKGLLTRCVLVLDRDHNVVYRDLVEQITDEPNYGAALDILKQTK
ncbi:MAG: thiol peroxidase [Bacteroidales bacterium]|nr:thiol peroxidase [Bacteroidales bacterium]